MEEGLLKIFADYLEDVEYLEPEHKNMLMQLGTEEKGRIFEIPEVERAISESNSIPVFGRSSNRIRLTMRHLSGR